MKRREIANNLFSKNTIDERVQNFEVKLKDIINNNFSILDAIEKLNLSKSRSETKRLIKSNAIKINDATFNSEDLSLSTYSDLLEIKISVGKKNIGVLKIKN